MDVIIYTLSDPETGHVRYVGKTVRFEHRKHAHLHQFHNNHKSKWVKSIVKRGVQPVMEMLEVIRDSDDNDWQEIERFWISSLRFMGCNLTNLDSGGHSGKKHSLSTLTKIGDANRGLRRSDESRLRMRLAKLGTKRGPHKPETIAKIRAANTGRSLTTEQRLKLSRSKHGRVAYYPSLETKEKLRLANLGKKRSVETCAHIGDSKRGIKQSEETKRKRAEGQTGKLHNDEWKQNISKAIRKHWLARR